MTYNEKISFKYQNKQNLFAVHFYKNYCIKNSFKKLPIYTSLFIFGYPRYIHRGQIREMIGIDPKRKIFAVVIV